MVRIIRGAAVAAVVLFSGLALADVRLHGAGATFPNPLYQRWVGEYQRINRSVQVDYQSIGSGGGVRGILEKTIDFGGSDAPLTRRELESAAQEMVHIPTVAGSVVLAYNLPRFEGELRLTGQIVADIYRGRITRWNDPAIAEINPDADLPNLAITPAWRTDGSGTTHVFTSYIAGQSDGFRQEIGFGKAVRWPMGQGGKGNEGVTAVVQRTPGAIGYIELNYAMENGLSYALMRNRDGHFVKATPQTVAAAGEGALDKMEESLAVDIWDQPGEEAYPISAFTYILVYRDLDYLEDQAKAQALVDFLYWATHDGQRMAAEMNYAPLSAGVQEKVRNVLGTLRWGGEPMESSDAVPAAAGAVRE